MVDPVFRVEEERRAGNARPYSISRTPLYLFSSVNAFGIGLMFGSLTLSLLVGAVTMAILVDTARGEARYLRSKFSTTCEAHAARTPFLLPDPKLYVEVDEPTFNPVALAKTFRDALSFLAVIPIVEIVEYLCQAGIIPDLIRQY